MKSGEFENEYKEKIDMVARVKNGDETKIFLGEDRDATIRKACRYANTLIDTNINKFYNYGDLRADVEKIPKKILEEIIKYFVKENEIPKYGFKRVYVLK